MKKFSKIFWVCAIVIAMLIASMQYVVAYSYQGYFNDESDNRKVLPDSSLNKRATPIIDVKSASATEVVFRINLPTDISDELKISALAGDALGDDEVRINDSTALKEYIAEKQELNPHGKVGANFVADKELNSTDSEQLLKYLDNKIANYGYELYGNVGKYNDKAKENEEKVTSTIKRSGEDWLVTVKIPENVSKIYTKDNPGQLGICFQEGYFRYGKENGDLLENGSTNKEVSFQIAYPYIFDAKITYDKPDSNGNTKMTITANEDLKNIKDDNATWTVNGKTATATVKNETKGIATVSSLNGDTKDLNYDTNDFNVDITYGDKDKDGNVKITINSNKKIAGIKDSNDIKWIISPDGNTATATVKAGTKGTIEVTSEDGNVKKLDYDAKDLDKNNGDEINNDGKKGNGNIGTRNSGKKTPTSLPQTGENIAIITVIVAIIGVAIYSIRKYLVVNKIIGKNKKSKK